jgi:hypothetical protein
VPFRAGELPAIDPAALIRELEEQEMTITK